MMQVYQSAGYKFKFNAETKSNIAVYKPNQTNSCCSILGPNESDVSLYMIKCEDWLLNKGILTKRDYEYNVGRILIDKLV